MNCQVIRKWKVVVRSNKKASLLIGIFSNTRDNIFLFAINIVGLVNLDVIVTRKNPLIDINT